MSSLELRFNGPIPKFLTRSDIPDNFSIKRLKDHLYRANRLKKLQKKRFFVYPSQKENRPKI